jgi:hypothetical protein
LIVQTMILSLLWHHTPHLSVPEAQLRRWRSMVNKFVLTRKYEKDSKFVQLIHSDFLYRRRQNGGLQVPRLSHQLQVQRLSLLQQFAKLAIHGSSEHWCVLGSKILRNILPFQHPAGPLLIFSVSPARMTQLLRTVDLSEWWKSSWKLWHRTSWPCRAEEFPPIERASALLRSSFWITEEPCLQYSDTSSSTRPRAILHVPGAQRHFRLHFARSSGITCLFDLLDAESLWPSCWTFVRRFLDHEARQQALGTQLRWLQRLHAELSQIYSRVMAGVTLLELREGHRTQLPLVGVQVNNKLAKFPYLQRKQLRLVVTGVEESRREHPLLQHSTNPRADELQRFLHCQAEFKGSALPVYEDLQLRLSFRMLPVKSRFWFLQGSNPRVQFCELPDCEEIETDRHLFLGCSGAAAVWRTVWSDWRCFFSSPLTWNVIALPHRIQLRSQWEHLAHPIGALWNIVRLITIHSIWTTRNRYVFENVRPPSRLSAVTTIYSTFSAHFRFLLRRHSVEEQSDFTSILSELRSSPSLGRFYQAHPDLFQLRRIQLCLSHNGTLRYDI